MGYSLSLLAVQSSDSDTVLSELNLVRTGQSCEYAREAWSGYALPSGWYIVVAKGCDNGFLEPSVLGPLSEQFPVIACSIEEHVMYSSTEYWDAGTLVWRAEHVGEDGAIHLKTSGVLPPSFQAMADAHAEQQAMDGGADAGVDHYFDIPLNAAKSIIGFKHDEDVPGVAYESFELLRKSGSQDREKPWWRFW